MADPPDPKRSFMIANENSWTGWRKPPFPICVADGVNVAARLEGIAEPGGIFVSRVVRDQVRDKLDLAFDDLGDQALKNIARPVRVYRVRLVTGERTLTASPTQSQTTLALPEKPSLAT